MRLGKGEALNLNGSRLIHNFAHSQSKTHLYYTTLTSHIGGSLSYNSGNFALYRYTLCIKVRTGDEIV